MLFLQRASLERTPLSAPISSFATFRYLPPSPLYAPDTSGTWDACRGLTSGPPPSHRQLVFEREPGVSATDRARRLFRQIDGQAHRERGRLCFINLLGITPVTTGEEQVRLETVQRLPRG